MAARKRTPAVADARVALEQYQDHLAPKLDVYEQAVYLYLLRHSRLVGKPQVTIELKTVREKLATGLGTKGSRISERTCMTKLKSLKKKGCVELIATDDEEETSVRLLLPDEIPGVVGDDAGAGAPLEDGDFVNVQKNRRLILRREGSRCFYCLKKLNESSFVVDCVDGRAPQEVGFRYVVACCRRCNNRKGESSAEDLVRVIYREGYISADELADRLKALEHLRAGRLKP